MVVEAPEALRAWLTKEMAPICDAEPSALAKYVLALLRKDKPEKELMEFCIEQLDVFLQTKARPFVVKLFAVLKDRSYIPPNAVICTAAPSPGPALTAPPVVVGPAGLSLVSTSPTRIAQQKPDTALGFGDSKRDVDERERRQFRDNDSHLERHAPASATTAAAVDRDKEPRKSREEKDTEKKAQSDEQPGPQEVSQKSVRKRISPPAAAPREESRRDHSASRFERRRSRSPRDRRSERGERAAERADRISDRTDRIAERTDRIADRTDRIADRPDRIADRPDRIAERTDRIADRPDRIADRGDRIADRADRIADRADRIPDRRVQPLPLSRVPHRLNERYKSERAERVERKRSRSPYERQRREKSAEEERERKKKRCRDYDEKGYCMKGDQCIYDHGPDPVVVDDIDLALGKIVTNGAKSSSSVAVVPQMAPNFSVPPPGYTPINPPPPGVDNVYVANSIAAPPVVGVSEGYNPEAPALSAPSAPPTATASLSTHSFDFSVPPPPISQQYANPSWHSGSYTVALSTAAVPVPLHPTANTYDPTQQATTTAPSIPVIQGTLSSHNVTQPQRRGRGSGMMSGAPRFPQSSSGPLGGAAGNRTLQVRKIPAELNNIAKLNEHFAQFGQIVNMQVCYEGDPEAALITYSNRLEAVSAYKSTVPILNNRFVKVFWHQPDSQLQNSNSQRMQSTSASSMARAAVTFNAKGSLTRTVHLDDGPSLPSLARPLPATAQPSSGTGHSSAVAPQHPTRQNPSSYVFRPLIQTSAVDREKYIEIRRKRKQEKENKIRLLDLHRRTSDLLTKQLEQQKTVIKKIEEATTDAKKKQFYEMFKKLDAAVKHLRAELQDLSTKLLSMNKADAEAGAVNGAASGASGDDAPSTADAAPKEANGATEKPPMAAPLTKRARSISDVDGHAQEASVPIKKPRHIADSSQALDKRTRVVAVRDFPAEFENDVVLHMENFGELVDMDVSGRGPGKGLVALFTYKRRRDAEQAVELGSDFACCPLTVDWAPKEGAEDSGVVPDEKRNPSERVTPAALLASCPLEESDDEGNDD